MTGGREVQGERIGLALLELNRLHQQLNHHRGDVLTAALASKLDRHVKEAARLLRGGGRIKESKEARARRRLWERDPHCFWCGRETKIDAFHTPDAATIEHVYQKRHPLRLHPRRRLPEKVLACYECNTRRGGYTGPPVIRQSCPLVAPSSTPRVYRLKRRA